MKKSRKNAEEEEKEEVEKEEEEAVGVGVEAAKGKERSREVATLHGNGITDVEEEYDECIAESIAEGATKEATGG